MRLLRLAALGALGVGFYRLFERRSARSPAAFAEGQGAEGNATQVRDAGPEAMRDVPDRVWDKVDEQSDESFPASDPPGSF